MAKTTAEKIKVMQAYDNDYEIEACALDTDAWFPCPNPNWNWGMFDFRVKKESTKRPMTFEEIVEYWKEHRTEIVENVDMKECGFIQGMNVEEETIKSCDLWYDVRSFCNAFLKEDGTKFEVEE